MRIGTAFILQDNYILPDNYILQSKVGLFAAMALNFSFNPVTMGVLGPWFSASLDERMLAGKGARRRRCNFALGVWILLGIKTFDWTGLLSIWFSFFSMRRIVRFGTWRCDDSVGGPRVI